MSVPAYAAYEQSGVEWLGEVPAHWKVTRLRFVTTVNPSKAEVAHLADDTMVSFLPMEAIGERGELDLSRTRLLGEVRTGYSYLTEGDVIFAKVTPCLENGKGALAAGLEGGRAFATTEVTVLRPAQPADARFLWWLTNSNVFRGPAEGSMYGAGGLKRVSDDWVADFRAPWPSQEERRAIATFLDRETGKIDALVEEQRRLIALLKEKRQAVISHAVTKGLNPNAPLKPSGIEWLGDVPAHWKMAKVARYFRAAKGKEGQLLTKEYCAENPGDFPVYSGQTASDGVMGMLDRYEFDAQTEGVLFSTTVGAKAMTVGHLFGRFSLSQNCMIIASTSAQIWTRFYYYHFQHVFQHHRNLIPDHMQPSFRMEDLYGFDFAIPPREEQRAIAVFLDLELAKLAEIESEMQSGILLLQERRAALISAAVTGKIDVRGLVTSSAAQQAA